MTTPTKEEVLAMADSALAQMTRYTGIPDGQAWWAKAENVFRAYAKMLEPVSDEEVRSAAKVADDFRLEHPTGEFLSCSEAAEADMRAALESFLAGRAK